MQQLDGWNRRRFCGILACGGILGMLLALSPSPAVRAADATWEKVVMLTASDGATYDHFGFSVAIDGNTVIAGSKRDDDNGSDSGSAYVFVRTGGLWKQQDKLKASDGAAGDEFGHSVDISGDTAIVGAREANSAAGAAYVFVRSGTTWTQQAKLTADGGKFGGSVAISGDTVVVGALNASPKGAAYVFVRSGTSWTQQAKLTGSACDGNSNFGIGVAISSDTIVVGSRDPVGLYIYVGAAYVFVRSGTSWSEQARLTVANPKSHQGFSYHSTYAQLRMVGVQGDTVIVGAAPVHSSYVYGGAAYVFVRNGTSWSQQAKITPSGLMDGTNFGKGVDLDGDLAIVGALGPSNYGGQAAYLFRRSGTSWSQKAKLSPAAPGGSATGFAVGISNERAVLNSNYYQPPSQSESAVAVYEKRGLLPPTADAGPDQSIHASDTVNLSGINSYDDTTASTDLEYAWSFVSRPVGSTATLSNATTATPSFTADKAGEYKVKLVVTDEDDLESDPDEVVISSLNIPPTADAGPDRVVIVDVKTSLSGSGYDPDGDSLTYSWTMVSKPSGSSATLTDASTSTPDLTPDKIGEYVLRLVVSDGVDDSDPDEVVVTAISSTNYARSKLLAACAAIRTFDDDDFTAKGHRHSMCGSIGKIISFLDRDDLASALKHLEKLIERTDGCPLRDSPDPMGTSQIVAGDWIVDCDAQETVYGLLKAAWDALTN